MNARVNPEGQFLRDALQHVSEAIDTLDLALDLLSGKDMEILNRWRNMPEAQRLREAAAMVARKAERIARYV